MAGFARVDWCSAWVGQWGSPRGPASPELTSAAPGLASGVAPAGPASVITSSSDSRSGFSSCAVTKEVEDHTGVEFDAPFGVRWKGEGDAERMMQEMREDNDSSVATDDESSSSVLF